MQWEEAFKDFYDLLIDKHEQHKKKPPELEKELRKVIKKGKEMLQELQRHDRSERTSLTKVEESEFAPKETKFVEKKSVECQVEAADQSYIRSERTSLKKVEESEFAPKETKFVEKKSVECQVEAADQSYIRNLEEELMGCKRDLEAKEREIESLLRRVAHYGDMRTKQDQRHVEDTLSLNRQSRVEQDFKAFTSHERIDTCIIIQKEYREKTDINAKRLTSMMFEVVYEYVLSTKTAMTDALKGISKFAVDEGPYIRHLHLKQNVQRTNEPSHIEVPLSLRGSDYPRHVLDGLLLAIKESAPGIDADVFLKDVKHEIFTRASQELPRERSGKLIPSGKLLHDLDDYLKACIRLTWRMVTQVPPLRLEYQTFTYKPEFHKIVESQDYAGDDRYQYHRIYYLWPGLVDGGGRPIIKGEVALEK